jgi:Arc/MetJ-type ribon-helix-helix transcriptional regulator
MVLGMATKKVTITLEQDQLERVQKLVAGGKAESVSGFVQHAVTVSLADVAGWGAMLGLALDATGGPLTRSERAWADAILKTRPGRTPKRRRRAA